MVVLVSIFGGNKVFLAAYALCTCKLQIISVEVKGQYMASEKGVNPQLFQVTERTW